MELINLLELKTAFGNRVFKLVKGDISTLDFPVDLLCLSSFANNYLPIPNTLIGSLLTNRGINLLSLSKTPLIDLRIAHSSFIVQPPNDSCIKYILCQEMMGTGKTMNTLLDSILISLYIAEIKGLKIKSIMMPLIGTGLQNFDPKEILGILLKKAEHLLKSSLTIEEFYLVAFTEEQADLLNKGMNLLLKRSVSVFRKNQVINLVTGNIKQILEENPDVFTSTSYKELVTILDDAEINSLNLAIISRKICEQILNSLLGPQGQPIDLSKKILLLKTQDGPPWMINYFHMLRIFGNSYAHESRIEGNTIKEMNKQDVVIALFALERIIEYYLSVKSKNLTA